MTDLLLGKSIVDITPPIGLHLAGWAGERYSDRIHQPLTCRALHLQQSDTVAVIVSVDSIGLDKKFADEIRAEAANRLGIPAANVMLSATHTHSSPILPPCLFPDHPQPDAHYMEDLKRKVAGAVLAARRAPVPVTVGFGRGQGDLGVNRRLPYVNGKSGFPPKADPSQPIDREIGVIRFDALDGGTEAVLFSYGCHPTVGGNSRWIGPDYPGPARRLVEAYYGERATAVFLLGNCGEIRANYTNPDGTFRWDVTTGLVEQAGARIGAEVVKTAVQIESKPDARLAIGRSFADLYMTNGEVATRCEFQAFRIGDAVIVSNPGECFPASA